MLRTQRLGDVLLGGFVATSVQLMVIVGVLTENTEKPNIVFIVADDLVSYSILRLDNRDVKSIFGVRCSFLL